MVKVVKTLFFPTFGFRYNPDLLFSTSLIMRKITSFLLLLSLLLATPVFARKEAFPLRVATYNIRMNTSGDKENAWPHRAAAVRALINFHQFDLVGTQEGFVGQLKDILELPGFAYVGIGRDDGKEAGEHSAIFYRTDRFEVLQKGNFWFSTTPEVPSLGWDAKIRRICSWAQFKDKKSGKKFFFFNSHFDHQAPTARRESAKLLLQKMEAIAGKSPFFCTGDFNATPADEPIQILSAKLADSYTITENPPYGPMGTFQGFKFDAPLTNRIDYIFVSPAIRVIRYGVLSDSKNQRYPSDHLPVMIDAEIQ